jgi:hypothetical protein
MEWLTLLLLVPAIVVPVVLLAGFAGCDLVFPPSPGEPFEQTFAATLNELDALRGRCLVQRIESVRLSNSGSQVQVTLQALAESVVIDRILISQPAVSGDPYDSGDDLTDVSTTVVLVQPNTSLTLPTVNYNLDRTKPLLIAMDISDNSGALPFLQGVPDTDAVAFFNQGADEAATKDRSLSYNSRPRIYLVESIDVK